MGGWHGERRLTESRREGTRGWRRETSQQWTLDDLPCWWTQIWRETRVASCLYEQEDRSLGRAPLHRQPDGTLHEKSAEDEGR